MHLHISPNDGVPIYLQIVNQVKYLVASGQMNAGDELPSIRALAEQLVINPNTVARAYRELEAAGVVAKRSTAGTFISGDGSPLARAHCLKIITERIDALLTEAWQMKVTTAELLQLVRQRATSMRPESTEK